jgi:hypothetical protein
MSYGFIYLLGNRAMPCYYKIGCTERAPHERADELSRSTSVPEPFKVLLYMELEDFQRREQCLHGHLGDFRPNAQREFFLFGPSHMTWLYAVFGCYPHAVSFTDSGWIGDVEQGSTYPDPWVSDPEARDGLLLNGPSDPPIEFGMLRLIA